MRYTTVEFALERRPVLSSDEPVVRVLQAHEWRLYREVRLRALEESPNAFARTFEEELGQPDEYWRERVAGATRERDLPLIAEVGTSVAALAWGRIEPGPPRLAGLYQVWVAPEYRSQGIATKLLSEVVRWAREAGSELVWLYVTAGDSPARRLYERLGFIALPESRPLREGSDLLMQKMHLVFDESG